MGRAICDEFYGDEPVHGYGYGQDEDQGQLGAWYVMSSIGLFDVKGLTAPDPEFCIGSPLFKKVSVKLNRNYYKGRRFTILASADDIKKDIYIKDASLNGKSNKDFMVPFSEVVKGGKLRISLSDDFK